MSTSVVPAKLLTSTKKLLSGVAVVDPRLQDLVVEWVYQASRSLREASTPISATTKLAAFKNLHLILFDSHTKTLALKFLEHRPTSIALVESTQHNANVQREFVARYLLEQQQPNRRNQPAAVSDSHADTEPCSSQAGNVPTLLAAYHSSFKDLLVPSKSKPYNERFLKKMLLPDLEYFTQAGVEEKVKTIAFGCLPSPALQRSLLNSLFTQRIVHLHDEVERELCGHLALFHSSASGALPAAAKAVKSAAVGTTERPSDEAKRTVFRISDFTLVTLLHSTTFAQIVCGKFDPQFERTARKSAKLPKKSLDADFELESTPLHLSWQDATTTLDAPNDGSGALAFFVKSHRHYSFLFNLLFEVELLNGWTGFKTNSSFVPIPPDFRESSHMEKLEKAGIKRDEFYAISVRPREISALAAIFASMEIDLYADVEEILRVTFWLNEFTTEFRGTKCCNDELRRLIGSNEIVDSLLFDEKRLVTDVRPHEFLAKFAHVRELVPEALPTEFRQRYDAFRDQFLKSSVRSYVD